MITIDDFKKVELKVGTVLESSEIEGSEKLIKLVIDLGEEKPRIVLTGMKSWYTPDYFKGKQVVIVSNLEPRPMMGEVSEGMIVAVDGKDGQPILLAPVEKVENGSKVR